MRFLFQWAKLDLAGYAQRIATDTRWKRDTCIIDQIQHQLLDIFLVNEAIVRDINLLFFSRVEKARDRFSFGFDIGSFDHDKSAQGRSSGACTFTCCLICRWVHSWNTGLLTPSHTCWDYSQSHCDLHYAQERKKTRDKDIWEWYIMLVRTKSNLYAQRSWNLLCLMCLFFMYAPQKFFRGELLIFPVFLSFLDTKHISHKCLTAKETQEQTNMKTNKPHLFGLLWIQGATGSVRCSG